MGYYSIANIITWANLSQAYAAYGEAKKKYTTGSNVDELLHIKIYVERKSLEWQAAQNPLDTDGILYGQGNYVYALLGQYAFQAMEASGSGGMVVTPAGTTSPDRIDFTVSSSSYIQTGATSKVITQFRGFNLDFVRGGVEQTTVSTEPTYFTWDKTTGLFTCSPALFEDELIALIPV